MANPSPSWVALQQERGTLPKLCGADLEFGNFATGVETVNGTGLEAALALLEEINGLHASPDFAPAAQPALSPLASQHRPAARADKASQDWGRKFLLNGGCFYIDLEHLEGCIPEVLSAFDHLAATHALYRLAHRACVAANQKLPPGRRIHVLATNSDGLGHSFGSHLNFLITRSAWEDIFYRKLHYQGFLAAYQASSLVVTGLGKVGTENWAPQAAFQISQRADFFEVLTGLQTTYRRPILNTRDEPLCGTQSWREEHTAAAHMARLHVIFYDHNLCHVAAFLKVGVLQIILAMIESGHVDPALLLEDPLEAVLSWSHDPTLQARARLLAGGDLTAVELQLRLLDQARTFVESGRCDGIVEDASMILELWADTLAHLEARRWAPLCRRLDWVLKLSLLQQTLQQQTHLDWDSPEVKHLDHLYSSLDPDEGLYWACERGKLVDRLVPESRIERFVIDPPTDTRAWTRATLLRMVDPRFVDQIDWDRLRLRFGKPPIYLTLELPDPLGSTRADSAALLPESGDLWDALEALGATFGRASTASETDPGARNPLTDPDRDHPAPPDQ